MNYSRLTVNCFIDSVSDNLTPSWNLSSKEVKYINNGMIMWNMMKLFMSEVKIVAIDKVCWKPKIKYWDCIISINIWYNLQNDFNIKYMENNKRNKENSWKTVYNFMSSSNIFQNANNALSDLFIFNSIINNHSQ